MKNEPAFPIQDKVVSHVDEKGNMTKVQYSGLSKREYFAAMALQGILASTRDQIYNPEVVIMNSVEAADALIEALSVTNEGEAEEGTRD